VFRYDDPNESDEEVSLPDPDIQLLHITTLYSQPAAMPKPKAARAKPSPRKKAATSSAAAKPPTTLAAAAGAAQTCSEHVASPAAAPSTGIERSGGGAKEAEARRETRSNVQHAPDIKLSFKAETRSDAAKAKGKSAKGKALMVSANSWAICVPPLLPASHAAALRLSFFVLTFVAASV
jgi:hypothetical protein